MDNKKWFNQANPDNRINYGRAFNTVESKSIVDGLEIEQDLTLDVVYNGGSIILILLIILVLMGAFS